MYFNFHCTITRMWTHLNVTSERIADSRGKPRSYVTSTLYRPKTKTPIHCYILPSRFCVFRFLQVEKPHRNRQDMHVSSCATLKLSKKKTPAVLANVRSVAPLTGQTDYLAESCAFSQLHVWEERHHGSVDHACDATCGKKDSGLTLSAGFAHVPADLM